MNRETMVMYLKLLIQSTEKKEIIIEELTKRTKKQEQLAYAPSFDIDGFNILLEEKENWIQQLSTIDNGFGQTFDRIKEQLGKDKDSYRQEIEQLQQVISRVTTKAVDLQALEKRNKLMVDRRIVEAKQKVKTAKVSSRVAGNYYQNMANRHYNESYFMDSKR